MDANKQRVLISPTTSVRDAMLAIDEGALAIALVVDSAQRLIGTVTDGDVRRAILRGVGLDTAVVAIMHHGPLTVSPGTDMQEIRRSFVQSSLKHIPVVDRDGRVVDILTISDLLAMPLSTPDITDREIQAVLEVLRTPDLSLGPKLVEFESKVASCAQRRFAVAVNSGTSALHLVVRALGLGKGDEVITTPFSFIASSNCLLYESCVPVFVDIEPDTYNLDPKMVEAAITSRTRAILVVDVFGQPARYKTLEAIAARHGLVLIADACESIGAEHRGRRASTYGRAGVFGFYPNKQITTGEGGAIFTDDEDVAALCRSMRNQGRGEGEGWLAHERLGYNYRLAELGAALGSVQLERIDEILDKRQTVADLYELLLEDVDGVQAPYVDSDTTRMSWFVYVVRLDETFTRQQRDEVLQRLRRKGIGVNNYFPPIHLQPFYREMFGFAEGDFPITESVSARTIALPFHNKLTERNCETVVHQLSDALKKHW